MISKQRFRFPFIPLAQILLSIIVIELFKKVMFMLDRKEAPFWPKQAEM